MMKSAVEQLSTYKSVHLNRKNIATHFVGIPLIIWALVVFMSLLSWDVQVADKSYRLTFAMIFLTGVVIYYFMLHAKLAVGLLLFFLPVLYTGNLVVDTSHPALIATGVFVIGWVFQFVGHFFEKAKPAFVDDLNQLLIGPFFMMAEVYIMSGFLKELNDTITPIAQEKRRAFDAAKKSSGK